MLFLLITTLFFNFQAGPQVVERHRCPTACNLDTLPWQCWIDYFLVQAAARRPTERNEEMVAKAA
jgi:hypothetical protein